MPKPHPFAAAPVTKGRARGVPKPAVTVYGYPRVSTGGQSVDAQARQLRAAGAGKVFREVASGAAIDRLQLRRLLSQVAAGAAAEDIPGAGLLAITSPDRLHRDWLVARARGETGIAERLLMRLRPGAALVTVGDFHPATLSWLGAVAGNPIVPLGVDRFGQSGDIADLYRAYGIDTEAILDAAARACLTALRQTEPTLM